MEQAEMPTTEAKPIPLIICPDCRKSIPLILFNRLKGFQEISTHCSCNATTLTTDKFIQSLINSKADVHQCSFDKEKGVKYCLKCFDWLCPSCITDHLDKEGDHVLCEYNLIVQCQHHKRPFSTYCKLCNTHQCIECQEKAHQKHEVIPLKLKQYQKLQANVFDGEKAKNRRLINRFIERINAQGNDSGQMKAAIQLACDANEAINEQLKLLYQSIRETILTFTDYPSYQLMRLPQFIINKTEFIEEEGLSIESDYQRLKEHLETSLAFRLDPTNECLASFPQVKSQVTHLLQLKEGRLASAVLQEIHLWNATTQKCSTLTGHTAQIGCLIELTDGRLASCSKDNTIRIWSTVIHRCTAKMKGLGSCVDCLLQLNDGRLALGYKDIKLWDTTSKKWGASLTGHTKKVNYLLQLSEGRLASASFDETIKLWNTVTNECIATLKVFKVIFLIHLIDGTLASFSQYNTIHLWSRTTNECIATFGMFDYSAASLFQLKDGRLVSCCKNRTKVWNSTTYECITTLFDDFGSMYLLGDDRLVSLFQNTIKLWNTRTFKSSIIKGEEGESFSVPLQLRNGRLVVYSLLGSCLKLYDI